MKTLRRRQNSLDIPAELQSIVDFSSTDSGLVRPVENTLSFTTERKKMISSTISGLIIPRIPNAVIGFVVAIVILTLNGMFIGRTWTHVDNEVLKAFRTTPSVANRNTPTAMSSVAIPTSGIVAACNHAFPNLVFTSFGLSMSSPTQKALFLIIASTGYNSSPLNAVSANVFDDAALAATSPKQSLADIKSIESCQSSVRNNHEQHYTSLCRRSQADNIVWPIRKRIEASRNDSPLSSGRRKSNNAAYMSNGYNLNGGRPMETSDRELSLIVLDPETGIGGKQFFQENMQPERLSGRASLVDGTIVCSHGNRNHERLAEMPSPFARAKSNKSSQRFDGGGGTLRMDFTDVKFGEGITWDTHVAIDPDRCYGVNPNDINVYELRSALARMVAIS